MMKNGQMILIQADDWDVNEEDVVFFCEEDWVACFEKAEVRGFYKTSAFKQRSM